MMEKKKRSAQKQSRSYLRLPQPQPQPEAVVGLVNIESFLLSNDLLLVKPKRRSILRSLLYFYYGDPGSNTVMIISVLLGTFLDHL